MAIRGVFVFLQQCHYQINGFGAELEHHNKLLPVSNINIIHSNPFSFGWSQNLHFFKAHIPVHISPCLTRRPLHKEMSQLYYYILKRTP